MITIFALILTLFTAWIMPVPTEVVAGASTTVEIQADFPIEIHDLVLYIDYDKSNLNILDIDRGDIEIPDDAICIMEDRGDGCCVVGILCPTNGIVGTGNLMSIDFKVSSECAGSQIISTRVDECYSMPLNGVTVPVDCSNQETIITVVQPTITDALTLLRGVLGLNEIPTWGDIDNNKVVNVSDVLQMVRLVHD